jgi:glycosyltransferase involved in cell wall biosynthesis
MRIGIDARKIRDFGIGNYIKYLLHNIPTFDAENTYIIFHYPEDREMIPVNTNFQCVADTSPKYSIRELTLLPVKMAQCCLDLFHAPHYTLPPLRPCRGIVTIHDVIHLRFPEYLPHPLAYYYAKSLMWLAARSARKIITVSQCSKQDIAHYLKVPEEKIVVIYNGIQINEAESQSRKDTEALKAHFGLSRPYLLYLGNFLPHKNTDMLIKAYALFKQQYNLPHCLVLAGKNNKLRAQLEQRIREEKLAADVILTGFVENKWFSPLYANADLFVYPSVYEGFGLQALEAMAHCVPVIASNVSSLPEITGDAAIHFDPTSAQSMAEAMYTALTDTTLRATLIEKGLERLTHFSWHEMTRRTVEVYREVLRDA